MIDIVIASDIKIYCEGLGQLIGREDDFNVTDVANNVAVAIASISSKAPDILLLDLTMPGSNHLAQQVLRLDGGTRVVALTVSYEENGIVQYAEAGVSCYVPREASVCELIEAIREAAKGRYYCPPKVVARVLKELQKPAYVERKNLNSHHSSHVMSNLPISEDYSYNQRFSKLTRRELQIARLLGMGLSNKQIAQKLFIEVSTVKNHVHNLLAKLDVKNRGQAISLFQLLRSETRDTNVVPLCL